MTATLGPKDPTVAAVVVPFVEALFREGKPTTVSYVSSRLRQAGIDVTAEVVQEAVRWLPFVPEPRQRKRPRRSR